MMSKSTRSISLPASTVLGVKMNEKVMEGEEKMMQDMNVMKGIKGEGKEMNVTAKLKGTHRGRLKEKEIEEHFGISSLCFKTDLMTVVQRKEVMERQKNMADININREIDCFSIVIQHLTSLWQEPGVTEVLYRLARQATGLRQETRRLAQEAASLGTLRQELSASHTVSVMVEYVDLLTERNTIVHDQLMDVRKVLGDNNIAIERPEEAVPAEAGKKRSLSMVSPSSHSAITTRRASRGEGGRSRSVCEVGAREDIIDNNIGVRKKSKKCSLFATISENVMKDNQETVENTIEFDEEISIKKRKKSSKKVSIAENLNCDYSDTNVSDEDAIHLVHDDVAENDAEPNVAHKNTSKLFLEKISNFLLNMMLFFFSLVLCIVQHPVSLIISFFFIVFINIIIHIFI